MSLPSDAKARKDRPICTGVLDYFPDALAEVAYCSKVGNDQHNPGEPLHWAREKSTDQADCIVRHLTQRGTVDSDGVRHSAKVAWRALALLQTEIEAESRAQQKPVIQGRYRCQCGWFSRLVVRPASDTGPLACPLCHEPTTLTHAEEGT